MSRKELLKEFIRYAFVGGIASIVDMGVFALVRELCFGSESNLLSIVVGTAAGFLAGICVNYILSMAFVFLTEKQQKQGKNRRAVLIFIAVGVVGLALSLMLQWLGERLVLGNVAEDSWIWKYAVKAVVMGIVLVWNYAGRKIFVFGGKDGQ